MKLVGKILISIVAIFFILNFITPLEVEIDYSKVVYDRNGEILSTFLNKSDKWRFKSELSEVSNKFKDAIIHKEDKYFYYHFGFNPIAITRATYDNLTSGEVVSGASTITMQLARLLEPKERTLINKLIELFRAVQLELYYSKDEILNMYIDLIPFGSNIEGVKSASIFYLNKKPNSLSLSESIALSLIPNNPNKFKIGKYNDRINEAKNKYIEEYISDEAFDINELEDAKNEVFYSRRHKRPKNALHLSTRLIKENRNESNINSTLDYGTQSQIENFTGSYISGLNYIGIHNASVIVIDNQTGEVVSYLGSNNFNDSLNAGQVDGVKAIRSPGSTLKPLVYLLAMDKGIITPKTKLLDIPFTFGNYSPLNFDRKFNGMVTAEKALSQSLNIPAVYLLNELGTSKFIQSLMKLNFKSISKNERKLGLSVVLGGCGVTLEELSRLYYCIANDGMYKQVTYLIDNRDSTYQEILNPEATAITKTILSKLTRPDYPANYEYAYKLPKIAWKTGTSYGRKDAWSIGFSDKYTVGVWVGNFNNKSVSTLTGASIATPLLFDIFNIVESNNSEVLAEDNIDLSIRNVCSHSGLIPNSKCNNFIEDYYIPFKSSTQECTHIQDVYVSTDEKYRYCSDCLPYKNYKTKSLEMIDPLLLDYYVQNRITHKEFTQHNPDCSRVNIAKKPNINSPLDNQQYLINPETDKIKLAAVLSHQTDGCSWFINNQLYISNSGESVFFKPEHEGEYKISCTDNLGQTATVIIKVKYI